MADHPEPAPASATIASAALFRFAELDSTNTRARELLRSGVQPPFVIHADRQTAGRGRAGRTWHSPPGVLTASWVLPMPAEPGRLALLAGLAVCRALADLCPNLNVGVKWPNDVVILECSSVVDGRAPGPLPHGRGSSPPKRLWRKVAGVLSEAAERALIVGIGVNVAVDLATLPGDVAAAAGTLGQSADDLPQVRDAISAQLWPLVEAGQTDAGWAEALIALQHLDVLRGQAITIEPARGTVTSAPAVAGVALGLDEDGRLQVDTAAGKVAISSGTVRLAESTGWDGLHHGLIS